MGQAGNEILEKVFYKYDQEAKDYAKDVFKEKRDELEKELLSLFFVIFQRQVEQIKKYVHNEFESIMEQLKQVAGTPVYHHHSSHHRPA